MHAPVAKAALEAGKHVLVEKPISLDTAEAEALIELSKTNERVFMAGQVLRFIPAYSKLREELASSGPVRSAFFRRRCAAPAWSNWLADPKKSGGGVFDLLIHDADYCIGLWGVPKSVRATGYEDLQAGVDWINAELTYPDMGPVVITGGWHHPKTYPFSMEFTVISAAATYEWPFGAPTLKKYAANGEASDVQLPETDAFAAELQYFTDCVNEGRRPEFCPPEQSAAAVRLMLDMLESRKQNGEKILCR
jgi:predicted dehydrogenase